MSGRSERLALVSAAVAAFAAALLACVSAVADERPDLPPSGPLPAIEGLPDPFRMADGRRVASIEDWRLRRREIEAMLQYYEYGFLPPPPGNVRAREVSSRPALDGRAVARHVILSFGPGGRLELGVGLLIPAGASAAAPAPVIVKDDISFGNVPVASRLIDLGYIIAEYLREDLDPDRPGVVGPAQAAYPEYDWGTLAVWAWGAMRVADYLETLDIVDRGRIAITGHSRGGKTALLAAALDERFALAAPNGSGAGGAACYRMRGPGVETLEKITEEARFAYWFHPRLRAFRGRVARLPLDQHFLAALVAPRALIFTEAHGDLWANPPGTQQSYLAAREVYRFLGAPERIGISVRQGHHDQLVEDWNTLVDFMELHLRGRTPARPRRFDGLPFPQLARAFDWRAPARGRAAAAPRPRIVRRVPVYKVPGRFGGWPANHGIWSWGKEILVGFGVGWFKDLGPRRHAIDRERPEEHWLARSLDGGETWSLEHPGARGFLVPYGEALHGTVPPDLPQADPAPCPGGIDFTAPGFALTARMESTRGPSRFHYSLDRGRTWKGPFRLPDLGTPGIAARTDVIVNGPRDCMLFVTVASRRRREGRPACIRTTDGGRTWTLRSFIGPEPVGFGIMPSTVRTGPGRLVTAVRRRMGPRRWIDAWRSGDDGLTWTFLGTPVADTGEGNPPALIRLRDGRLCLTYGLRAPPFSIRAVLSGDDGRTWGPALVLRDRGGGRDIGYTRSVERPDGKVVTVYYIHDAPRGDRFIEATIWEPPSRR